MTQTFGEKFPELKKEIFTLDELRLLNQLDGEKELVFVTQIEKHYFSRKRVKEVSKKMMDKIYALNNEGYKGFIPLSEIIKIQWDFNKELNLEEETKDKKCHHCNLDKNLRNPSGFCDHLHYPEYCEKCKELEQKNI